MSAAIGGLTILATASNTVLFPLSILLSMVQGGTSQRRNYEDQEAREHTGYIEQSLESGKRAKEYLDRRAY